MKDKDLELEFKNLINVIEDNFEIEDKEIVFYDLKDNIIAQPYFTKKFQLWKPFLYDMFPF